MADGRCGGQALQLSWCPSQWLAKAQSTTRQCPSCVLLVWLPAAQSPVAGLFEQMGDGRDGMVGLVAAAGGTFLQIKTCIVEELHIRVCMYMPADMIFQWNMLVSSYMYNTYIYIHVGYIYIYIYNIIYIYVCVCWMNGHRVVYVLNQSPASWSSTKDMLTLPGSLEETWPWLASFGQSFSPCIFYWFLWKAESRLEDKLTVAWSLGHGHFPKVDKLGRLIPHFPCQLAFTVKSVKPLYVNESEWSQTQAMPPCPCHPMSHFRTFEFAEFLRQLSALVSGDRPPPRGRLLKNVWF